MDDFEKPNILKHLRFEAFHLSSSSASDDGDFKALIAKRKILAEEREKDHDLNFETDYIKEDTQYEDVKLENISQLRSDAYKSNLNVYDIEIKPTIQDIPDLHYDGNQAMFKASLENGHLDVTQEVIEKCDKKILLRQLDDLRTPLQHITNIGNVKLAECLLKRLDSIDEKISAIKAESVFEVQGQRPRSLSSFHLAAFRGFTQLVKLYVDTGIDINLKNSKRDTALLWASRWGHSETVKYLLSQQAECDIENDKGSTALYWAVRYEHLDVAKLLLTSGKANPSKERLEGFVAPIVLASALGNAEMVRILIQNGANPNHTVRNGETPLHVASTEGHDDVLLVLLNNKANIDCQDENGNTSILNAVSNNRLQCIYLLGRRGADTTVRNHAGKDVWDLAVENDDSLALRILCKTSKSHNSPHLKAAKVGCLDKIKIGRECGIDIASPDKSGNTLIHYAAFFDNFEIILEFSKAVNINKKNNVGNTALHLACSKGNLSSIQALLAEKARADILNNEGRMPLHVSAVSANTTPEIVQILVEYVIKSHTWECLNSADQKGDNALHLAAESASPGVLWEFRQIRFKDLDKTGNTPLHDSVRPNDEKVLETMLDIFETVDRDANINSQNKKNETVLHLACSEGFRNSVARIIYLGGDLSIQDCNGHTLLHRLILRSSQADDDDDDDKEALERECICMIDTIINNAVVWWCIKNKLQKPDQEESLYTQYKRESTLCLLHDVRDASGFSVVGLACHYASSAILSKLMAIENITCFHDGNETLYDVTNFTQKTRCSETEANFQPYLQILAFSPRRQNAAQTLNIPPLRKMEGMFKSICMTTYMVLIILHVIYMSVLSYSTISLLGKLRTNSDDLGKVYVFCYVWTVIEPFAFVLYCIISVGLTLKRGQSLVSSLPWKFIMMFVVFTVLAIVWITLLVVRSTFKDYILSVLLCHGWLLTIAFTRGIRGIHYFWEMLKMMIVRDIFRFLIFYSLVLLAFSFAFHSVFQISPTISNKYENPGDTMFMVINVMIGIGELFDDDFDNGFKDVGRTVTYSQAIYLLYIVLANIRE